MIDNGREKFNLYDRKYRLMSRENLKLLEFILPVE